MLVIPVFHISEKIREQHSFNHSSAYTGSRRIQKVQPWRLFILNGMDNKNKVAL